MGTAKTRTVPTEVDVATATPTKRSASRRLSAAKVRRARDEQAAKSAASSAESTQVPPTASTFVATLQTFDGYTGRGMVVVDGGEKRFSLQNVAVLIDTYEPLELGSDVEVTCDETGEITTIRQLRPRLRSSFA
jgi:hypothetical protein